MAATASIPSPDSLAVHSRTASPRELVPQVLIYAVTLILVAAPFLVIGYQSFQSQALYEPGRTWTLANYSALLRQPEFFEAVRNSFELAIVTTAIATVIGLLSAVALGRFNIPGRKWLETAMLGPIYISQLVMSFGWYVLYGRSGYGTMFVERLVGARPWDLSTIAGMGMLGGLAMAPYVMVYCSSSLLLANASLEDAARSVGAGPLRVIFSVTLPLLRPAIVYSSILTFVGGLELLSIPLIFGWSVGLEFFTTYLMREGLGQTIPNYGKLGAAAILLLLIVSIFIVLQRRLIGSSQRFVTVRGKAQRGKPMDIGRWRWLVAGVLVVYVLFVVALPLAAVVVRAFVLYLTPLMSPWRHVTLAHFHFIFNFSEYRRSITNSIKVAALGAGLATVLISMITLVIHRSEFRFRRSLEALTFIPRAMPGMLVGIGFLWVTLLVPGLGYLHGTVWILMIAFTMGSLPSAYATIAPSLLQIGRELDQSARICGASWWTTCRRIVLPIAKPALIAVYGLLFITFLKEYAAAVFLIGAGGEIIGTEIMELWAKGFAGPVAALSVIQLVVTLVAMPIVRRFGRTGVPSWQT